MVDRNGAEGVAGDPPTINDANTVPVVAPDGGQGAASGVPTTLLKASTTKTPVPAAELLRTDAGNVEATTVAMERSGAERVVGQRVVMDRSGAQTVEARSAQLDRSGVVQLEAEHAVMQGGTAFAVVAQEARIVRSQVLINVARATQFDAETRVFLQVGPSAPCTRPVVGAAGAAGFGAAFALVAFLLGALRRRGGR
jgi:hypothetical protein